MSGTTDRLRNSFRELGPKVEWIAARLLDRIEAECPELSSLAAVARVSGVEAVAQFLAVVARSDGVPEAVGRYLDGAEDWVQAWGLTDQHVAVAREVLLETLAEASGGDWDVETESAWAEALEAVDARLRPLVAAGPSGRRTVRQANSVRQTESAEPPGVGRPGRRVPGGETPAETPSMLTDTMTPPRVAENGASAATEALPQPTTDASRADARTRELVENSVAVQAVLESATRARSVSEAITAALDTVREKFGWAYGSYWALDRKENVLRFSTESGSVNAEFRQVTERATFAEGVGLSGRAWRQRDLVFVPDLAQVGDCVRAPAARRAGVKSGVCFPLIVGGEVIGTMDFFSLSTLTL
ncbi:MAG TPA: GAF domain-containing protein, partial [Planctomycetaceae bacterium]